MRSKWGKCASEEPFQNFTGGCRFVKTISLVSSWFATNFSTAWRSNSRERPCVGCDPHDHWTLVGPTSVPSTPDNLLLPQIRVIVYQKAPIAAHSPHYYSLAITAWWYIPHPTRNKKTGSRSGRHRRYLIANDFQSHTIRRHFFVTRPEPISSC